MQRKPRLRVINGIQAAKRVTDRPLFAHATRSFLPQAAQPSHLSLQAARSNAGRKVRTDVAAEATQEVIGLHVAMHLRLFE